MLNQWPGRLLEAEGDEVFLSRTATSFAWRYGLNSDFAGFTVTVTGTGFGYIAGDPVVGTMTGLTIRNALGQVVLTMSGLSGFAADLSQFAANVFGGGSGEGPGPDGKIALSHLMSANDVINVTAGDDRRELTGTDAGNDTYNMGAGDDKVVGGLGNDTYNGGIGYDEFSFGETQWNEGITAIRGATINRQTGVMLDPWGGTDRIFAFESFFGSRFNDVFIGSNTEQDGFRGMRGNDVIDGGNISFVAGILTNDRNDVARYDNDYWGGGRFGVVVDLETSLVNGSIRGTARDGFGNRDTLIDIERAYGTRFGDTLVGSRVDNVLGGGEGRDTYDGGGGFDVLEFDFYSTNVGPVGINVNLSLATGQIINDGFGNTETALNFEELRGSRSNDIFRGNALSNVIEGRAGADTLSGGAGRDYFNFWRQDEMGATPDRVTDFVASGPGADFLAFGYQNWTNMTTTVRVVNGAAATTAFGTFLFINATDQLIWDSNGNGAGGQTVIAILTNVTALSIANFEMWG